ncbi:hypothetical protein BC940DRAFT_295869 [Gongronella butleri]|nr:hypothetical protein BC940DRAFT_295869 [Gongronella butleri]
MSRSLMQRSRNIYGVAVFSSRLPTYMDKSLDFPSSRYEQVTDTPIPDEPKPWLAKPRNHLITASAAELTAFVANNGYWNCLCLSMDLEAGKSEVISIDAVEVDGPGDSDLRIILAMAVAEKQDADADGYGVPSFSLRIYGHDTPAKPYLETTLANITSSSQIIELEHAPMQLAHTTIQHNGEIRFALLLTSTDGSVHVYLQDKESRKFERLASPLPMPVLQRISDQKIGILFMHIDDRADGTRVVCAGGQEGDLFLAIYDEDGNEIKAQQTRIFSPITSVLLFQPRVTKSPDEQDLSLVVTTAIEQATVYRSIREDGLTNSRVLPQSAQFDSVLCSHAMDVDWDGEREILIGTYGRQLIIYKHVAGTREYNVLWRRQFAYPLYRVVHVDLNCDGLDELLVLTMYGMHILQPNLARAKAKLLDSLQYIEGTKRQKLDLLMELKEQKELEKAIIFES